ncbi:reverse transcriptase domain-containing protein [Tanacetum coccineum]
MAVRGGFAVWGGRVSIYSSSGGVSVIDVYGGWWSIGIRFRGWGFGGGEYVWRGGGGLGSGGGILVMRGLGVVGLGVGGGVVFGCVLWVGPWIQAIVYLHGEGVIVSGCLGDMKKHCIKGKLELVVGVVKSCTQNSLGDMTVTLKDPTCTMGGTIHYKVFQNEDDGYAKSINVGSVLILRDGL